MTVELTVTSITVQPEISAAQIVITPTFSSNGGLTAPILSISKNGVNIAPDELKNVDIEVPTKTSDLTNDSDFVSDPNYVHTDNNYDDLAVQEVSKIADKQDATDDNLETNSDTIVGAINEVNSIAKGANQALSFDDYQAVIAAMLVSGLNAGQNLYVDTLDVPDLWVKVVEVASVPYTYVSDEQFITDILAGTQIGYYRLALLETQKVDLTNYYTKDETDQAIEDYASPLLHTHSGETINPEAIDFDTTPSTDPNTVGRLQWSATEKTLEFGVEGGTIDVNKELFDYYVDTNNNLVEGNVVSVTGISGNRQAVEKTNNTNRASATACIGMVTHKNVDNTVRITKKGRVRKLNTGGMTEGLPVYANATGGYTQTEPAAGTYFIHVGIVEVAHTQNGIIDVDIRIVYDLEDLSNVDGTATTLLDTDEHLFKDLATGLWKKITHSNLVVKLSTKLGNLTLANTWSLLQTFTSGLKTTKIIPQSDTTGVVITKADGTTSVLLINTNTGYITSSGSGISGNGYTYSSSVIHALINGILSIGNTSSGVDSAVALKSKNIEAIRIDPNQRVGFKTATPETDVDVNGTTTHRDWVYLNNGTHTGDVVGDIRVKNESGVLTFYRCTAGHATKGSGTWVSIHTIG